METDMTAHPLFLCTLYEALNQLNVKWFTVTKSLKHHRLAPAGKNGVNATKTQTSMTSFTN